MSTTINYKVFKLYSICVPPKTSHVMKCERCNLNKKKKPQSFRNIYKIKKIFSRGRTWSNSAVPYYKVVVVCKLKNGFSF